MPEKKCFKCQKIKKIIEFYKHRLMFDGYTNKCKECTKKENKANRLLNIKHYLEYDKKRGSKRGIKGINLKYKRKQKYKDIIYKNWKGSKNDYRKIHYWVQGMLGRPKKCSICGTTDGNNKRFHWANISHLYKKELTDWIRLCAHCHSLMDKNKLL